MPPFPNRPIGPIPPTINLPEVPTLDADEVMDNAENVAREIRDLATVLGPNFVKDFTDILTGASNCLHEVDKLRVSATERAIEYGTAVARIVTQAEMSSIYIIKALIKIIEEMWGLERPFTPRLYRLNNPRDYHNGAPPWCTEITTPTTGDPRKKPLIFVHGKGCDGTKESALAFYDAFERAAHFCTDPRGELLFVDDCEVYFVAYDSDVTDDDVVLLENALAVLTGGAVVTGNPARLYLAVMWQELERRARKSAELLFPLITGFTSNSAEPNAWIFSASLGAVLVAEVAQRYAETNPPSLRKPFFRWESFAPALPSNAFTNSGRYRRAPEAFMDDPVGVHIYFSRFDAVLLAIYFGVNLYTAMGTSGPLITAGRLIEIDTSSLTRTTHPTSGFPEGDYYFPLLGPCLRYLIGKHNQGDPNPCLEP